MFWFIAGFPQAEYLWVKDGQYLGEFSADHFYKIQYAKKSDAGQYQCIARNDAGAIFSEKIGLSVACKLARMLTVKMNCSECM